MSKKPTPYENLFRDLFFVGVSIFVSIWVVRIGVLQNVGNVASEARMLATFIAGIFFTSAFTVAPAAVVLAQLAEHTTSPYVFAFWGACGALVGDLTLFLFVSDRFTQDVLHVMKITKARKVTHLFKKGYFRWLSPLIGAIIIASPIPDEVGIAMMGISKTKLTLLVPISFVMNYLALFLIASVVHSV